MQTPREQHRRHWAASFGWIVLLVVVYVLGVGPAFWLIERELLPEVITKALVVLYWPVGMVYDHTEGGRALVRWYLTFWLQNPPPP